MRKSQLEFAISDGTDRGKQQFRVEYVIFDCRDVIKQSGLKCNYIQTAVN